MDFQALYKSKLTTAEEAVKLVKSGDWVDYTWCTNHPYVLDQARDRQGRRRRRALRLALLALLRHRPQDHRQGHGLVLPHALLRAAPLLS